MTDRRIKESTGTCPPPKFRKIRICIIMDFIFGTTGGTENQVLKLMDNLDRNRFEVHFFLLSETPWLRKDGAMIKAQVRTFGYNVFNHKDPKNALALIRLFLALRDLKPDVTVNYFRISYFIGVLASRLAGVKGIISTRRDFGLWLKPGVVPFLRFANLFVRRIVANSQAVKDLVVASEKFPPDRVSVIYNGISNLAEGVESGRKSALKSEFGIPEENRVVGIVAGLRPMKRHDTFLTAAKLLLQESDNLTFLVIGDGPEKARIQSLVNGLGIEKNVLLLGWQQDVKDLLPVLDVGVNCSEKEGLSNAIMEYMVAGVPTAVSRAGGNEELIKDGISGLVFETGNAENLCRCIRRLLDDPLLADNLAQEARVFVRTRLTMERMIREHERLFAEVAGRGMLEEAAC